MKKIVVIGVIALFVGAGVQPALAVETKSSVDTIEEEEDCDCQTVDRVNLIRAELLLNKLKVFTKVMSLKYGHIPKVEEKTQELFDVINSFNLLSGPPIICAILTDICYDFLILAGYFFTLSEEAMFKLMFYFWFYLGGLVLLIGYPFVLIGDYLGCWEDNTLDFHHKYNIEIQQIVSRV